MCSKTSPLIFLAHGREDLDMLHDLIHGLESAGWIVHIDDGRPGQEGNVENRVLRILDSCSHAIICVSWNFLISPWIDVILGSDVLSAHPWDRGRAMIIRMDECPDELLPSPLADLDRLDMCDGPDPEALLSALHIKEDGALPDAISRMADGLPKKRSQPTSEAPLPMDSMRVFVGICAGVHGVSRCSECFNYQAGRCGFLSMAGIAQNGAESDPPQA